MSEQLFYRTEKGLGNEDWYYYYNDSDANEEYIIHRWSHSQGGPFNFKSDEQKYTLEDFKKEKPAIYKKLLAWLKQPHRES